MDGPSVKSLSSKVVKDGFLVKRGLRGARWQKRWFVLTTDNILYYYRSETAESPKGQIMLRKYSNATTSTKKPNAFVIYSERNAALRVFYFAADEYQDVDSWLKEIESAIKRASGILLDLEEEKSKYSTPQLARLVAFTVVEAKNLTGKDPYAVAQVASRYVRTRTIHKNPNPFWGDSYVLDVDDEVKQKALDLQVTVMDDDWLARDKVLGHVNIPLSSLQPGKLNEQWYPLSPIDVQDVVAGMIHVIVDISSKSLQVRVVEGRELASRNADGSSDPFIEVRVGDVTQKTQIIKKTLNPFWNKRLVFNVDSMPEFIKLTCWDWDMLGGNNHMGEASVVLSESETKDKIDMWYMLTSAQGKKKHPRHLSDSKVNSKSTSALTRSPTVDLTQPTGTGGEAAAANVPTRSPSPVPNSSKRSNSIGSSKSSLNLSTSHDPALTSKSTSNVPTMRSGSFLMKKSASEPKKGKEVVALVPPQAQPQAQPQPQPQPVLATESTKPKSSLGEVRLKVRYMVSVILPFGSYDKLLELLLEDKCALAAALGSVVAPDERENLAISMVKIFTCRYSILTLLRTLTTQEINNTLDPEIIFRSNSLASKAMEYYMRISGNTYLQKTVGPSIKHACAVKKSYEVDPMKAEQGEDVEGNQKKLVALAEGVAIAIYHSDQYCPTNFRELFCHLQETVLRKWGRGNAATDKVKYSVVSGFLFLRFFCPAILGPKLFNLMDGFPDPKTGRTLTLLSKIVQNLANLVEFGQKEPYMAGINSFVTNNFANMKSFLDKIATPPRGNWPGFVEGDTPQVDLQREVAFLHSFLNRHKAGIIAHESLASVKDKLVSVLDDLDGVAASQIKLRKQK